MSPPVPPAVTTCQWCWAWTVLSKNSISLQPSSPVTLRESCIPTPARKEPGRQQKDEWLLGCLEHIDSSGRAPLTVILKILPFRKHLYGPSPFSSLFYLLPWEVRNYPGIWKTMQAPSLPLFRTASLELASLDKSSLLSEPQFTNL